MKNILFKLFAFATILTMSVSCKQDETGMEGIKDPIEYRLYGQFIPTNNQVPADGIVNATYTCRFSVYLSSGLALTCTDPYISDEVDKITVMEHSDEIKNKLVKWGNSWFTCEEIPTSNAQYSPSKVVINFEPNDSGYERKVVVRWILGMVTSMEATFIQPPMEQ